MKAFEPNPVARFTLNRELAQRHLMMRSSPHEGKVNIKHNVRGMVFERIRHLRSRVAPVVLMDELTMSQVEYVFNDFADARLDNSLKTQIVGPIG